MSARKNGEAANAHTTNSAIAKSEHSNAKYHARAAMLASPASHHMIKEVAR